MVYFPGERDDSDVVAQAQDAPVRLRLDEVEVMEAGKSREGEVWSPQLLPFRSWDRRVEGPDGSEGGLGSEEGGGSRRAWGAGTDGDLLVVGARGMGITDEERERLLQEAALDDSVGGSAAVAVPTRRGLPSLGADPGNDSGACAFAGAIAVRREGAGWALVAFDLRCFAESMGVSDGLAVVLPSFVGGDPVVRVAPEAFSRRFVQGVGVRVLVVPDTVERIGAGALAALPGRHIHLGAAVRSGGAQACDLAGLSPRLERRTYSVSAANGQYGAREGSLFSRDGRELLFLAPPYERDQRLPEGVERIGEAAFCAGVEVPRIVRAPRELAHVEAKGWDGAVWSCPSGAPARAALQKRGVRVAGPDVVEQDGCWFDFDDEGAVLVAGPCAERSASARFAGEAARLRRARAADGGVRLSSADAAARAKANDAHGQLSGGTLGPLADGPAAAAARTGSRGEAVLELPSEVSGCPVRSIAARALLTAPETLIVPAAVERIEDGNACKGMRRLVLPESLREIGSHCFCSRTLEGPVPIPAGVRCVGEGSFEYATVLLAATGDVVHIPADQLLSCWVGKGGAVDGGRRGGAEPPVLFDFARYDELLKAGKSLPDRLGAVLHRLAHPHGMAPATRAALVSQLRDQEPDAMRRVAREGDRSMVEALTAAGFIDERTFDRQVELLRSCNRMDCVAYLMQWRRLHGATGEGFAAHGDDAGAGGEGSVAFGGAAATDGKGRGGKRSSRERFAL